ncbi:MAG: hypothetical protein NC299_11410 [Lachnospiraceae bacterium]|nr:hypothetical protein [Ruminococcus sp.]MCM1275953.1 hypothetical protein [Lachnospiraceae bacterium]
MIYGKYPDEETVNEHIKRKEPLIIAVPFDGGKPVLIAHIDDAFEHHILLAQFDIRQTDIDKYFRIAADDESAEWTFVCPRDYKGIADSRKRIMRFYNDGFAAISEVLSDIGYFSDIRIPKRYRRHFDAMGDDGTYMP